MFDSPYQTSGFSSHLFDKTGRGIRKLEIEGELIKLTPAGNIVAVPPGVVDFPPFYMFLTKDQIPHLEADVVIDGRGLLTSEGKPSKLDAYNFYLKTAELIVRWMKDDRSDLLSVGGDFLTKMYGQWLRNAISSRLGLDFNQTYRVQAAATVFYIQQHIPLTTNSNGRDVDRVVVRASRALPSTDPLSLMSVFSDNVPPLNTLVEMLQWTQELIDSVRASGLSVALARTALGRAWPVAYRDISNAAIEYPPVFASMVYHSLKSSGFVRTELGDMLKRSARGNDGTNFIKNVDRYLSEH